METTALITAAISIAFFHTLLGPDHYLPFIMISQARNWSVKRTLAITFLCGLGHVASSVALGMIGIALGSALNKLEIIESTRGEIASWLLITFGLFYAIWGIKKNHALKNKKHKHPHHSHSHSIEKNKKATPWILFTIFVFGPCEPLIPLLMFPAIKNSSYDLIAVSTLFAFVTILTMLSIVALSLFGINKLPINKLERHMHTIAGTTILCCGLSIKFLGL